MNTENSFPNPFDAIEKRSAAEWERFLLDNPEWLDALDAPAPAPAAIRTWEDIPSIFSLAVPKTEWIVEGLLPRGSVTLIAGEPGSYKSWLSLSLLRSVATGQKFLDRACVSTSVLYLDRENPHAVVRERLAILGVESLDNARIWGGWLADMPPAIGDYRLLQIARERRPLLIIDSLIRFHREEENSATEMARVMQDLRALANEGATVVVLHHRAKSEASRYRGSSDIADGVDTAFALSRDHEASLVTLTCFKSRYAEEFAVTLRPDLSGSGDFLVAEASAATAARQDTERLAQAIREKPGQTQGELIEVTGIARDKARALLARFDGQLWRSERGAHYALRFFPLEPSAMDMEL